MKEFAINLPPSWVRLDLTRDPVAAVDEFVRLSSAVVPPLSRAKAMAALRESFLPVATDLAAGGAAALVLSVRPMDDLIVQPMVVFLPLTAPEGETPLDLMVAVAATDPSATVVDINDLVGLRVTSTADASERFRQGMRGAAELSGASVQADPDGTTFDDITATDTRVRYFVGDPGDDARWVDVLMSVSHSSISGSSELAQGAIALFDASMQTFRWVS